jgi:hypothetical protein
MSSDGKSEYTAKVAAHVAGALDQGEVVVAATPGAPSGSMRAIAYGRGRRLLVASEHDLAAFGVPYNRQYVIALSDRRFLWFRTTLTGRPKGIVATIMRGDVDELLLGEGRVLGQRFGELHFTRRDGSRCGFEVARIHVGQAEALVAAFHGVSAT